MPAANAHGRRPVGPHAVLLLASAALVLAGADWGSRLAGDSFLPGGPLDETAHLMTALIVLWALGRGLSRGFVASALLASVLIDLDHVPQYLGHPFLTEGTPRPYPHSLLTLAIVLAAALWRARRAALLGVAAGLAIHFWRDLSEPGSGVALLWPLSDHPFSLPHWSYVALMALAVSVAAVRLLTPKAGVMDIRPGSGLRVKPRARGGDTARVSSESSAPLVPRADSWVKVEK